MEISRSQELQVELWGDVFSLGPGLWLGVKFGAGRSFPGTFSLLLHSEFKHLWVHTGVIF